MSIEEYRLLYRFTSHMSEERRAKFFDLVMEICEHRQDKIKMPVAAGTAYQR